MLFSIKNTISPQNYTDCFSFQKHNNFCLFYFSFPSYVSALFIVVPKKTQPTNKQKKQEKRGQMKQNYSSRKKSKHTRNALYSFTSFLIWKKKKKSMENWSKTKLSSYFVAQNSTSVSITVGQSSKWNRFKLCWGTSCSIFSIILIFNIQKNTYLFPQSVA